MRTFRDATLGDAAMLCAAERQLVSHYDGMLISEPEELLESDFRDRIAFLADGRGKYLIAEVDGRPVGHACLLPMGLRRVSHVLHLDMCIHVGYWRRGHGEALLLALLSWARQTRHVKKVELLVRAGNTAAVNLYKKLGFIEEGRLRNRVRLRSGRFVDDLSMAMLLS